MQFQPISERERLKQELKQEIKAELQQDFIGKLTDKLLEQPTDKQLVPVETMGAHERFADAYELFATNAVVASSNEGNTFVLRCKSQVAVQIQVLTDHIFRFRYAIYGEFEPDFSYAISPDFQPQVGTVSWEETQDDFVLQTAELVCKISKANLNIRLQNTNGQTICEDATGFQARQTILKGIDQVSISKKAAAGEHFFGLGDKSCSLNLRGKKLENWNTDAFAYQEETGPLYRTIPFYYGLRRGKGYGIFMDNTYRSHFDFDSEQRGTVTFSAEGGEMNYYFIYGPALLDVARRYTELTGRPELPPLWALGYHQSRWSYHPESRVYELAQQFRAHQIPCDAIYLDIDYMDGYRCFTWNTGSFPNPKQMIADLKAQGFQTILMIDPGIKVDSDYWVYQQGLKKNMFCRRTSGQLMLGPVWPSHCVFPDYTNPDVRAWWADLYEELYQEQGVSGFWNDMNEPAVFKVNHKTFPDEVLHHYDGYLTDHRKAHNIYGMQMTRATHVGLKKFQTEKRPFLLARATYSGGQRYAAIWTGDNIASWEHLTLANRQCQRLSISGFSFVGTDVGGFVNQPDGELLVRWLQLGIFHPVYRIHSMGNNEDGSSEALQDHILQLEKKNRLDQEPWSFGEEYTNHARAAIELRYRLLPYLYTAFWQYSTQGTPMLRSLIFYDQQDVEAPYREEEFLVGDHLLVSPVLEPQAVQQTVYLPKGKWFDFYEKQSFDGNQWITISVRLDRIPIFIKAGAVLPLYPVQQYVGEKVLEELTLLAFYTAGTEESQLYEDAGEGYAYRNGDYKCKTFRVTGTAYTLIIEQQKEGQFVESYSTYKLELYGLPFTPTSCVINGEAQRFDVNAAGVFINVTTDFKQLELR